MAGVLITIGSEGHSGTANRPGCVFRGVANIANDTSDAATIGGGEIILLDGKAEVPVSLPATVIEAGHSRQIFGITSTLNRTRNDAPRAVRGSVIVDGKSINVGFPVAAPAPKPRPSTPPPVAPPAFRTKKTTTTTRTPRRRRTAPKKSS